MKTLKASAILAGLILTLTLASCGPAYVGAGYGPGYGYYGARPYAYRPAPVIVRQPRVIYRSSPRYYRSGPPAYGRRYNSPGHRRGPSRRW